ncbi:hypothetical protein [Chryseobacterium sp. c4a]|uniref:hypothetical protein n=1 Tax=Chryseobacterium sp. c4a TaxID=1573582 RepID=UPI00135BAD53|nr:hypothetical protein [Chryseobacterium sp. c4a]
MKKIILLSLLILVNLSLTFCQKKSHTEKTNEKTLNMSANTELIFSKELDKKMSIECYINSDNNFYYWEFNTKGKESKTIDKFKISKLKLGEYSRFANRPNFYKKFRILSVFKNTDNLIFLIDKFGQVDVHIYSMVGERPVTIIPIKKYKLIPMDVVLLVEDFQDTKLINNTLYTLSILMSGASSVNYISKIDLSKKNVLEASIDVSSGEFKINQNIENKAIVRLDSGSYQVTGYGFRFSLLDNNQIKVEENQSKSFITKIDFKPPHIDKNEDVNKIIEHLP